jgi:uncharacterized protein YkwD
VRRPAARHAVLAVACLAGGLIALLAGASAFAGPIDVVNDLRRHGCGAGVPALVRSSQLDAAAGRMARGAPLHDALAQSGYRADEALAIHVSGSADDASLRRMLAQRYCAELARSSVRQVGVAQGPRELRLVLATPFEPPSPGDAAAVARRVLALVNEARSRPRRCGGRQYDAAPPLRLSATLGLAALAHSREMAASGRFAHEAPDGSTPRVRVERTGYDAVAVGENIAAGPTSPDEVMRGWLASPGHCTNVMAPAFTEMGLAFAVDLRSESGIYWTQVFATRAQRAGAPSGAPRPSRSGRAVPSTTNSSDTELMQ